MTATPGGGNGTSACHTGGRKHDCHTGGWALNFSACHTGGRKRRQTAFDSPFDAVATTRSLGPRWGGGRGLPFSCRRCRPAISLASSSVVIAAHSCVALGTLGVASM